MASKKATGEHTQVSKPRIKWVKRAGMYCLTVPGSKGNDRSWHMTLEEAKKSITN